MAQRTYQYLKDLLLVFMSGAMVVLSFPSFDLGMLAWVGLVPLLFALHGKSYLKGFFMVLFCGMLFWTGLVYWLMNVPKYTLLHYVILMPYLGCFFGLFGLRFSFISKRWGITPAHVAAPFVWVVLDYIRTHFFWLALPWGMLAHSQYHYPAIIQIASYTGAYGVSFLVMAVNSALTLAVLTLSRRWVSAGESAPEIPSGRIVTAMVLVTTVMVAGSLLYGRTMLSKPIEGDQIKISVVQGNIPQDKKWDKKFAAFIMQTYADLTLEASKQKPALIAWPETATPVAINLDRRIYAEVWRIAQKTQIPLITD